MIKNRTMGEIPQRPDLIESATISQWLISDYADDAFKKIKQQWMVSVFHLRPIRGVEAHKGLPEATHELTVTEMDLSNRGVAYHSQTPVFRFKDVTVSVQFEAPDDYVAEKVCAALCQGIQRGFLDVDPRFNGASVAQWQHTLFSTLQHISAAWIENREVVN